MTRFNITKARLTALRDLIVRSVLQLDREIAEWRDSLPLLDYDDMAQRVNQMVEEISQAGMPEDHITDQLKATRVGSVSYLIRDSHGVPRMLVTRKDGAGWVLHRISSHVVDRDTFVNDLFERHQISVEK